MSHSRLWKRIANFLRKIFGLGRWRKSLKIKNHFISWFVASPSFFHCSVIIKCILRLRLLILSRFLFRSDIWIDGFLFCFFSVFLFLTVYLCITAHNRQNFLLGPILHLSKYSTNAVPSWLNLKRDLNKLLRLYTYFVIQVGRWVSFFFSISNTIEESMCWVNNSCFIIIIFVIRSSNWHFWSLSRSHGSLLYERWSKYPPCENLENRFSSLCPYGLVVSTT